MGCFKLVVLVYLGIYGLLVIGTGFGIIEGTLRDGYFDLQSAFAWMLPLALCFPSSLLAMPVIHKGLSWLLLTIAIKLLGFKLDDNDLTEGVVVTISMTVSFILAGVIQYYLLMLLVKFIKFLSVGIGKSKAYGSITKKAFEVIKKEDIKKVVNYLFIALICIGTIFLAWKFISKMSADREVENATANSSYRLVKSITVGLNHPSYLAIDGNDNLYVSDTGNRKIQKFDKTDRFVTSWGKSGKGDGEFGETRCAIAVDDKYVYVADSENSRVQKFTNAGKYVASWGKEGAGDGEFKYMSGIDADKNGQVFVNDYWNHRVEIFDNNGKFVGLRKTEQLDDIAIDSEGNLYAIRNVLDTFVKSFKIYKFDSKGNYQKTLEGGLSHPNGICVDKQDNLYVADSNNNRVVKFSKKGKIVAVISEALKQPSDVAVDSQGGVYVSDTGNNRIQKFVLMK